MKHHDLWELGQQELLLASLLLALLAGPVGDAMNLHRLCNRIGNRLLGSGWCDGELVQSVRANVAIRTVLTLDDIRNLEARELIKEGNLVTHELDELMGVTNTLACRHVW